MTTLSATCAPKRSGLLTSFVQLGCTQAIGLPLSLLTSVVLARALSPVEFGRYGLALAFASVLAIPMVGSAPMLLVREVARYCERKQFGACRGLVRSAIGMLGVYSALLGVIASICWSLGIGDPMLSASVLLVPILGMHAIASGVLRGLGHPLSVAIPVQLLQPCVAVGLLLICVASIGIDTAGAFAIHVTAASVALVAAAWMFRRFRPRGYRASVVEVGDRARWWRSYLPFACLGAVNVLQVHLATLLLAFVADTEGIAYLRIAERGGQLVALPMAVLTTILGPQIVRCLEMGETRALQQLLRRSVRLVLAATVSVAAVLVFAGEAILRVVFGEAYAVASYAPLVVVIVGQVLFAATGPAELILAMAGDERHNLRAQFFGLLVLVVLGSVLVPQLGALGAASAAAVAVLLAKAHLLLVVRRRHAVWTGIS